MRSNYLPSCLIRWSLMLFPVCLSLSSEAQPSARTIAEGWLKNQSMRPVAALEIHVDRNTYLIGETLRFQWAAVPTQLIPNGDLLFELRNAEDRIVHSGLMEMNPDKPYGQFTIPLNLATGNYQLLAAVAGGNGSLFRPCLIPLYVLANDDAPPVTAASSPPISAQQSGFRWQVEGGQLINDLDNRIYFQSLDEQGNPLAVEGYLEDELSERIASFRSATTGSGYIPFSPRRNRRYTLVYQQAGKNLQKVSLPAIDPSAYQLSVREMNPGKLKLQVALGDSLYKKNVRSIVLVTNGSQVIYAAEGTDLYTVDVPLENVPSGALRAALYNRMGELVSERWVYHRAAFVQVKAGWNCKAGMADSLALQVEISGMGLNEKELPAAISVIDNRYSQGMPSSRGVFDILATQTWSTAQSAEFLESWMAIAPADAGMPADAGKAGSQHVLPSGGLTLGGSIENSRKQALAGHVVNLFSKNMRGTYTDTTDASGRFQFEGLAYPDSTNFFLQVQTLKNRPVQQVEVRWDPVKFPALPAREVLFPQGTGTGIPWHADRLQAYRQKLRAFLQEEQPGVSNDSLNGKRTGKIYKNRLSAQSYIIDREDIVNNQLITALDAMPYVPGVQVNSSGITIRGLSSLSGGGSNEPTLIVDGVMIGRTTGSQILSLLSNIPALQIDYIEVLRGSDAAIYGSRGATGVISIVTLQGDGSKRVIGNGLQGFYPPGYTMPQFSPVLPHLREPGANTALPRATVYWNPVGKLTTNQAQPIYVKPNRDNCAYTLTLYIRAGNEWITRRIALDQNAQ